MKFDPHIVARRIFDDLVQNMQEFMNSPAIKSKRQDLEYKYKKQQAELRKYTFARAEDPVLPLELPDPYVEEYQF